MHHGGTMAVPPVILIHGAGGNYLHWPNAIRRMSGFDVLAVDLPGHGRSKGAGSQQISDYTHRLFEFFSEMGLYRVILAGTSMGGSIALEFAASHPEITAGVAVLGGGCSMRVSRQLIESLRNVSLRSAAFEILRRELFAKKTGQDVVRKVMRDFDQTRYSVLFADWLCCRGYDLSTHLEEINCPVWMAVGVEDVISPPAEARYLQNHWPLLNLELVPKAGHMLLLEQPCWVSKHLGMFLRQIKQSEIMKNSFDLGGFDVFKQIMAANTASRDDSAHDAGSPGDLDFTGKH
jgi:pimeloyl-ACP methyl ester carboxylesterase